MAHREFMITMVPGPCPPLLSILALVLLAFPLPAPAITCDNLAEWPGSDDDTWGEEEDWCETDDPIHPCAAVYEMNGATCDE